AYAVGMQITNRYECSVVNGRCAAQRRIDNHLQRRRGIRDANDLIPIYIDSDRLILAARASSQSSQNDTSPNEVSRVHCLSLGSSSCFVISLGEKTGSSPWRWSSLS